MTSPARAHYQRTVAATAAATDTPAPLAQAHANAYELMLAQLTEDRRRLKAIQSIERKIELKRELLPRYAPWIDGSLQGDRGGQDDVLMTALVWHIDVGQFDRALQLAEYALRHGLTLPDQYKRDVATLVAEEIAEAALTALAAGVPVVVDSAMDGGGRPRQEPAVECLQAADSLTAERDMPDEVRAKLHKAIGLSLAPTQPTAALDHLRRALALHERVGVKKDIERLERELKKTGDAG